MTPPEGVSELERGESVNAERRREKGDVIRQSDQRGDRIIPEELREGRRFEDDGDARVAHLQSRQAHLLQRLQGEPLG